jgi:tocopherol cyclase
VPFSPTLFHPERYHGHGRRPPFFEGWYFKLVDPTEQHRYAVIPGIFLSRDPAVHHSFVQILDGSTGEATYHRYPADGFQAERESFDVRLGGNRFGAHGLSLDISDEERTVRGSVRLVDPNPWPVTLTSLGIMGPYGWAPRMECYHGVVSLDHGLEGSLEIDGAEVDFTGGRGYVEKDWGKSFPAGYVWMQSNHFDAPGRSFVGSIAIIPWIFSAFPGFIIGLWIDGTLHRFATYTKATTDALRIDDSSVEWRVSNRTHALEVVATRAEGGLLYGPTREAMSDRVGETMRSEIALRLSTLDGEVVFEGTGRNAGLEIHGDLDRLLEMQV